MKRIELPLFAALAAIAATGNAQQPTTDRLRSLAQNVDSASLVAGVRERPADARALLGELIMQAGTQRGTPDSILRIARRVATAYAIAWQDSFPIANLARFEQMSAEQRVAKVAADSIRLAGNAVYGSQGVSAAMSLWRQALLRAIAVPDTAGIAAALGNLGAGFFRASELDSADAYLTRARQLAEAVGDRRTALNALGTLGSSARERGDLRRAQETYSEALQLRAHIGDVRGMAADHNNLGLIAVELGDPLEARAHYRQALGVARQHRLEEAAANALLNLGNVASVEGEYADAAANYREALRLYRSLESTADVALVLHNLGLLELRRGDYRAARDRLAEALGLFARVGTVEDMVRVRRDLASVDAAMGNLRGAMDQLRRAEQQLARNPGRYDVAAAVALAQADLAVQLNTYAEADRQYARAQALYRRAGNTTGETEVQQGRAMLLVERKQYARALEQLHAVARRQAESGDRRSAALTRVVIGYARQKEGKIAEARQIVEQSRDTLRALQDRVGEAAALAALGDLELRSGAPLAAEAHYREGLARVAGRSAPTVSWHLHAGVGRALASRGALGEAVGQYRLAIAEVERVAQSIPLAERRSTFLADKWDAYQELALLQQERGDYSAAFDASERMRARQMLDLMARGRVRRVATADSALVIHEQDLRARIGELTQRLEAEEAVTSTLRGPDLSRTASGVTREGLARAQAEYAQLLLELRDDAGGIAAVVRAEVASWRVVAARLAQGQAMLTYLVTDSTTLVFVLTPDTMRVLDLGVSRGALVTLIDFARGTIRRPQPSAAASPWRAPLRRLHRHLVAPLEESGVLAGVRQLVIVPHAELHYLPFAALLRSGERGRDEFLIERYDVAYAPSATTWLRLGERGSSGSRRVLALAPRSKDLPGSREEVEAIRALYGREATVLMNGAATEQAFRAGVERYGIVHLATYGVLNQHNPLFSFVELSRGGEGDGRLEVHEVFGLSLNARLLVLSACQTALASGAVSDVPAGDDWVGLVRAFLGAGAENVIATLWAVEDRASASVMERLHKRLRAGDPEGAALSQAQRQTLRNPATAGPFYWAGFVLVGGR